MSAQIGRTGMSPSRYRVLRGGPCPFASRACSWRALGLGVVPARFPAAACGCLSICIEMAFVRVCVTGERERTDGPWIDMNWPNFNAAPLIRPRVDTSRLIFASLINTLPPLPLLLPLVDRRIDSDAAPIESDAASALLTSQ